MNRLLITLLLLTVSLRAVAAQSGGISGLVRDARLGPLIYAQVQLTRGGETVCEVLTDYEGHFVVKRLQPGIYAVTVAWKGGKDITREVTVVQGATATLEIIFSRSPAEIGPREESSPQSRSLLAVPAMAGGDVDMSVGRNVGKRISGAGTSALSLLPYRLRRDFSIVTQHWRRSARMAA